VYQDLLKLARDVAVDTAAMIAERRRDGVSVSDTKSSPIDIVTDVDKAAEERIYRALLGARPDDGFVGEEGRSAEPASGVTWVVDPIDGTVNFLYGVPAYAVSIAAMVEDRSVAGVVVNVATGEVFEATLGGGAFCDGRPLAVRETPPMAERLVMTGFNYVTAVRRGQALAAGRLLPAVRDIRRSGSAALDLCALGAGRADAYVEEGLHLWDRAAGGLVATEAGAVVEVHPGAGGMDCVVAAPASGFADFSALVRDCGFLAE
jgi:myo-inositol-1(or 4)-monophosphatase